MTDFTKFFKDGDVGGLVNLSEIEKVAKEARNPNLAYTGKINGFGRITAKLEFSANLLEKLGWGDFDTIEVFYAPKKRHFFLRHSETYGSTLKVNQKSKKATLSIEHPNPEFFPEMKRTNIVADNYRVEAGKMVFWLPSDEPYKEESDDNENL